MIWLLMLLNKSVVIINANIYLLNMSLCVCGGVGGDENGGTQGPKSKSWALDVSPL